MLPVAPRAKGPAMRSRRWGVILAGGDGVRLRPLTKVICGDERPKQFCPLFDGKTLLGQTLERAELIVRRSQLMVSLTSDHGKWYSQEVGLRPSQRVVQPVNKGTGSAIVHSLLSLARLDAQALVAILPCDHHYSNERSFASALESAFETAAVRTDSVILLGAQADYPEVEYGWIELGEPLGDEGSQLFRVQEFREKPAIDVARRLFEQGSVLEHVCDGGACAGLLTDGRGRCSRTAAHARIGAHVGRPGNPYPEVHLQACPLGPFFPNEIFGGAW